MIFFLEEYNFHIMSFEFHRDRDKYFNLQSENTNKYIIPFIEKLKEIDSSLKVLEVGCRDGGVLLPFLERGCHITGVELSEKMLLFKAAMDRSLWRIPLELSSTWFLSCTSPLS